MSWVYLFLIFSLYIELFIKRFQLRIMARSINIIFGHLSWKIQRSHYIKQRPIFNRKICLFILFFLNFHLWWLHRCFFSFLFNKNIKFKKNYFFINIYYCTLFFKFFISYLWFEIFPFCLIQFLEEWCFADYFFSHFFQYLIFQLNLKIRFY